jgi:hypothetical protein
MWNILNCTHQQEKGRARRITANNNKDDEIGYTLYMFEARSAPIQMVFSVAQ